MNVVEIEERIEQIAKDGFKPADFIYDFMTAFDAPRAILKQLRHGPQNPSEIGGTLWRRYLHYKGASKGTVSATIDELQIAKENSKHKVRFIISTDGSQFAARDLKSGETLNCDFSQLGDHFGFFLPLANIERYKIADENPVDIKATGRLAKFYDSLLEDNPGWRGNEKRHTLNHFITQIVFCLFAEDTGIFPKGIFSETLKTYCETDTAQTQTVLANVFAAMSLPETMRGGLPSYATRFPYVNGGLFGDTVEIPRFLRGTVRYLLDAALLDWREINPDIFGSMIQSIVNEDQRGELGMHYTSVPNILKVLDPLFLDDLRDSVRSNWDSSKGLQAVLRRVSKLRVFDPACGSGNFLVIAYRELRHIEHDIIRRLTELGGFTPPLWSNVDLRNFYGIEYADFAAETAKLSLWISEYQMNSRYEAAFGARSTVLPLKTAAPISCGNALRISWESVCPHTNDPEANTYIVGNPPYLGKGKLTDLQKDDMAIVFERENIKYGYIDYVGAWFYKGAEYLRANVSLAFVATNSVGQGRQAPVLWPCVLKEGKEFSFIHTSFKWSNNAARKASVFCVIVSIRQVSSAPKYLFANGLRRRVSNITAYFTEGKTIYISPRTKPLSMQLPEMNLGNKANDDGNLILEPDERDALLVAHPTASKFIRRYLGSRELNNNLLRYCLWIRDEDLAEAKAIPYIASRIEKCKRFRGCSSDDGNRALALRPHQMREMLEARNHTVFVSIMTSQRREYLACGLEKADAILSGQAFALYDAPLWSLALLCSKMHFVWVAAICGQLKEDYRYSNDLGWNTFPIPTLSEADKSSLTKTAEGILLARDTYFDKTISELYDPESFQSDYPELLSAHRQNDEILETIYGGSVFKTDVDRLEHLFNRYSEMVGKK